MTDYDVIVVGGGPAGSTCAWKLREAGLSTVVIDKATFPRDKVCAGWITPPVIDDLRLEVDDYRKGRTFQAITGFGVGVVGSGEVVESTYSRAVSFGIRRCEFDEYLLRRSTAHLRLGSAVTNLRREGGQWIVGEAVRAPMLVGAGGHFCPVARMMNGGSSRGRLVAAQEVELRLGRDDCRLDGERPELYFRGDLKGYGWCFRKGDYVNIGFGLLEGRGLPHATAEFARQLLTTARLTADPATWRWRGHAYHVSGVPPRRVVADGVLLVGDAAGLAYPQSGEGIRPAIESGLLAAASIVKAGSAYTTDRMAPYAAEVARRFDSAAVVRVLSTVAPSRVPVAVVRGLLRRPWFVRHVALDRWFLRRA